MLPLERRDLHESARFENISLPQDVRGNVHDYRENVYESPIKTSAGQTHFGNIDTPPDNYFGHTRIEDMADNKTRRVIEVQSDLYQKGNLEKEIEQAKGDIDIYKKNGRPKTQAEIAKEESKLKQLKLQQYNDPTAHFRMIREEVKKAAEDGKSILQFPTGETAMKIEGLGDGQLWTLPGAPSVRNSILQPSQLKTDLQIEAINGNQWIITDVLGDGKFKAVPKDIYEKLNKESVSQGFDKANKNLLNSRAEQFDISDKVDTNNPIYKFYEKEVGKYLKNKYNAQLVTDKQGVTWWEVPVKPQYGKMPIEAFAALPIIAGNKKKQD